MAPPEGGGDKPKSRPVSAKLAERAAMFGGSPTKTEVKKTVNTGASGGGVKARLAAMKQQQEEEKTRARASNSEPEPVQGGGVKARLAALKVAGGGAVPVFGQKPPSKNADQDGIKARLAKLQSGGGIPMIPGGRPQSMPLSSTRQEETKEMKQPEQYALQRATIHSKRRTKTVKKQDFDSLVQAIEETSSIPDKEEEIYQDTPPPPPPTHVSTPTTPADEWVKAVENKTEQVCTSTDAKKEKEKSPTQDNTSTQQDNQAATTDKAPPEPRGSILSTMLGF